MHWKKDVVVLLEEFLRNSRGDTSESHEKARSVQPVTRSRILVSLTVIFQVHGTCSEDWLRD
jgi:hypothetical protein